MDHEELKRLIDLFEASKIAELEIEEAGVKIRLKKGEDPTIVGSNLPTTGADLTPRPRARRQGKAAKKRAAPRNHMVPVTSPIVGTFYRAPSPDAPPYVEVGDVVEKGKVLCVVEAMKLMNEIESEMRGRIAAIQVENAQPVEYGEVLFLMEPLTTPA